MSDKDWRREGNYYTMVFDKDVYFLVEPKTDLQGDDTWRGSIEFRNNKGIFATLYDTTGKELLHVKNELIRQFDIIVNRLRYINTTDVPGQED